MSAVHDARGAGARWRSHNQQREIDMRIKSRPTFDAKYAAACRRMEAEKQLEIRESKKLHELRRAVGAKRGEAFAGFRGPHGAAHSTAPRPLPATKIPLAFRGAR